MNFRDLISDIQARAKKASIDRKTRNRLRSYRSSGQVKFPRLFGYRRTDAGVAVVESEARPIRLILEMLAKGESVGAIKRRLDGMNLRGRSGNLLTQREIAAMVKPVYAGMIETQSGKWVKSKHYPAIVSAETVRKARKAVERLSEGRNLALPALDEGVFLTPNALG